MSFFGALFSMAALGMAMAALSLGAIFSVYGKELPEHEALSQYRPKEISRVYSGEGQVIDEFKEELRLYTPAEDIPDLVKQAFISAEDKNFYVHDGYDVLGIAAALRDAVQSRGQDLRGASTITQQVAKNLLLSSDRTIERKIREIILAELQQPAGEEIPRGDARRPIDGSVHQPLSFARAAELATPHLDAMAALAQHMAAHVLEVSV